MSSRSSKANRYGTLAEYRAVDRYGLRLDRGEWHDARTDDDRPVNVKAAMLNRRNGPGRFRLWETDHRRLRENDGLYVFVSYHARGRGIVVDSMRSVNARDVQVRFYGAGGHREQRQVKVNVGDIL